MRFAAAATAFASMAYTASAFGVRNIQRSSAATTAFAAKRRSFAASSTRLHANVLKLTEPQSQLLDDVDVFIFDCDGVIWRVSHILIVVALCVEVSTRR